jgi:dihydrofolate synthase/folylpolyglutamate synthase
VVFDGAHNLDAARQLARWISKNLKGRPLTLVVGILDDKPYRAMLKCLLPLANRVIFTQAKINRALPAKTLLKAAQPMTSDVTIIADVAQALKFAVKTAPAGGLTLVAGSLYIVGEAQTAIANGIVRFNR